MPPLGLLPPLSFVIPAKQRASRDDEGEGNVEKRRPVSVGSPLLIAARGPMVTLHPLKPKTGPFVLRRALPPPSRP